MTVLALFWLYFAMSCCAEEALSREGIKPDTNIGWGFRCIGTYLSELLRRRG